MRGSRPLFPKGAMEGQKVRVPLLLGWRVPGPAEATSVSTERGTDD